MTRHGTTRRLLAASLSAALLTTGLAACSSDGDSGSATDESVVPQGTIVGSGDTYEATIRRTADEVPHISGATVADVAFGQGWASGQDRACDLPDQVLKIKSERSKWFGPGEEDANVNSDFAWKAVGLYDRAVADWADVSPVVKETVTAFTAGWNEHLEAVGSGELSDWCAGAEWVQPLDPADTYAYIRSLTLLASSWQLMGYLGSATPPTAATDSTVAPAVGGVGDLTPPPPLASNGWTIGSERSETGGGMLLGNPHFPWEGELRFWEVHLTVPGEVDAYGATLSGVPGIAVGFTDSFAWTHTVSAGNRFTAYTLDLVPGDPTSYTYGGETRAMTSAEATIEVLGPDGALSEQTRTLWSSHYGPILDFPGVGWSEAMTVTYRDANADNDEFLDQYLAMLEADDLDGFIDAHRKYSGVPLFNTIATSADGRAWYADTAATPNLSDEAIAAYQAALETDPAVKLVAGNGAVLLDGSDPINEWVEVEGARDPGLVPFEEMPMTERDDYLFNANDSFWISNADNLLTGDYSPLHGSQQKAPSPRTRQNAAVLSDASASGASGDDGKFSLDELADASLANEGFTAAQLRAGVVERCTGVASVDVPPLLDENGAEVLSARPVDISGACAALDGWDGVYDVDRVGPPVWREWIHHFEYATLTDAGPLWATPYDPSDPLGTPSGLAPAPADAPDPLLVALGQAVLSLEAAGFTPDATLGEVQFALRAGERVPMHGGDAFDGTTNVVATSNSSWSILDPAIAQQETVVPDSPLRRLEGEAGYPIRSGTSFIFAVAFGDTGPQAKAMLTYGQLADREDPTYVSATERFSTKDWRTVAFTPDAVAEQTTGTLTVHG